MNGLIDWWRLRSQREQRLLLVMLGLAGLVLGWLLVVRPLGDALDAVQQRHGAAVVALAEARARSGHAGTSSRPSPALPIDGLLGRTASEAGFAGARVAARGPAGGQVTIEAARPQAVFQWVTQLEAQGLTVQTLRARTNPDRTIFVEVAFRARSGR